MPPRTHHAYFYEGPLALQDELVAHARTFFNFNGEHNPDVVVETFEKFGIDDSQSLKGLASFKSTSGHALFVIGIGSITSEAQQALLKLFEEPSQGSTFVLLVPHGVLLPTLRSRLMEYPHTIEQKNVQKNLAGKEVADFLKHSYKARSTSITALLKDDEGAKERVRALLDGLERLLYIELKNSKSKKEYIHALEDIAKVRSYVNDRSPSLKMLLEHLAATLPTI